MTTQIRRETRDLSRRCDVDLSNLELPRASTSQQNVILEPESSKEPVLGWEVISPPSSPDVCPDSPVNPPKAVVEMVNPLVLIPGQWIKFRTASCSKNNWLNKPFKVLLVAKKVENIRDAGIADCFLFSQSLSLHLFKPAQGLLGNNFIGYNVPFVVLGAENQAKIEAKPHVFEYAEEFLKSLVFFRKDCTGYDPSSGQVKSEGFLKLKYYGTQAPEKIKFQDDGF